jgi:hypothetical protein
MAVFKELSSADIKSSRSFLSQLVDVLQEDVSGSVSRRKSQHFITGTVSSIGVTSSLFQTVYDSDFTLQTSNAIMDMTFGLLPSGSTVLTSQTSVDAAGKELFPSSSLMMREKMDVYRQFAQSLLGDASQAFYSPFDSTSATDKIDVAVFVAYKRLFARDKIKRETFAMKFNQTASLDGNIHTNSTLGGAIYTDMGAATNKLTAFGGEVGNVVDSANTSKGVGLMFYDRGILVLDLVKITSASQYVSGTIDAVTPTGQIILGSAGTETAGVSKFIPDFVVSASIDNIIDHVAGCRMGSGSATLMTFQNVTNINSSLIFCRAAADEFNYSSNVTYTDDTSRIVVISPGQEDTESAFSFITGIGMYDSNDNLLAVGKVSRPIEKNSEKDLTLRVRIDYSQKKRYHFTA